MKLGKIVDKLNLEFKGNRNKLDNQVNTGYVSDLLSDVIANGKEGDLWITLQTHQNIAAVASMKGLAGIVLVNGKQPEEETIKKAAEENIPIMVSNLPAFELVGRLYEVGISGIRNHAQGL